MWISRSISIITGHRDVLIILDCSELQSLDFDKFCEYLKEEVGFLRRLEILRLCFLDDEGTYVDVTERNFCHFQRKALTGAQRINLKVFDGTSPAPMPSKYGIY